MQISDHRRKLYNGKMYTDLLMGHGTKNREWMSSIELISNELSRAYLHRMAMAASRPRRKKIKPNGPYHIWFGEEYKVPIREEDVQRKPEIEQPRELVEEYEQRTGHRLGLLTIREVLYQFTNHVRDRITQKARKESEEEYKKYINIVTTKETKSIKHIVAPLSWKNQEIAREMELLHGGQAKYHRDRKSEFDSNYLENWIYTDPTYNEMNQKGQQELWDHVECRSIEDSYWKDRTVPTLGSSDYYMQAWDTGVRHMFCTKEDGCIGIKGVFDTLHDPLSTLQDAMKTESRNFRNYLELREQKEKAKLRKAMIKENN